ncbi:MAG: ABC transporter permease subunit [Rhizobiales bacterium]|nr:ABC transporter permease subunit [Hyphomicrobiales bacterium]
MWSFSRASISWTNPGFRAFVYQAISLVLVVTLFWFFISTAHENLQRLHIATGFGFLENTAGFGIIQTLVPYSEESSYGQAFLVGLLNTLVVAGVGIFFATVLGFIIGIARLSSNWLIAKLAMVYIEVLRNIPLLLQLFFWYFAILRPLPKPIDSITPLPGVYLNNRGIVLPQPVMDGSAGAFFLVLFLALCFAYGLHRWALKRRLATGHTFPALPVGAAVVVILPLLVWLIGGAPLHLEFAEHGRFDLTGGMRLLPEFIALTLGLALYTAAFIAEIVRAGILSVSKGQTEAAYALGLKPGQTLRFVVIPQSMRLIIPPLTSQLLNLTKNSSLAVAIGYPDLVAVFSGTVLNQTGQAIEVISITMAVYLVLSLITSFLMNIYNARAALRER